MSIQKFKFTDLDKPQSEFLLSILYDRKIWHYNFSHTINGNIYILLMKSFRNEGEFLEEIISLQKIFRCSIIADNYDLKKMKSSLHKFEQVNEMFNILGKISENNRLNPIDLSKFDLPKEKKEEIEKFIKSLP